LKQQQTKLKLPKISEAKQPVTPSKPTPITTPIPTPPQPKADPQPKQSLLPKRVITIFGPESSGSTFLSSVLGTATGAFAANGKWMYTPLSKWTENSWEVVQSSRWTFEETLQKRATSPNGWEVQHLSLPWGMYCQEDEPMSIVESFVPEECWRYQELSHLSLLFAEHQFWAQLKSEDGIVPKWTPQDEKYRQLCQEEVHISELNIDNSTNSDKYTCGAKCGTGLYNGFALYPKRFFVNITSHIEWYLRRGVDITVVLSVRDRTMSAESKLNNHCSLDMGAKEDEVALELMSEALERFGKRGSDEDKARVVVASYEGLMRFGKEYLFDLYEELG
jgi:hypothetical protein